MTLCSTPAHPRWPLWECGSPGPRSCTTAGRPCPRSSSPSCCSCIAGRGGRVARGRQRQQQSRRRKRSGEGLSGEGLRLIGILGSWDCCLVAPAGRRCPRRAGMPRWSRRAARRYEARPAPAHPRCTFSCRWNALSVCRQGCSMAGEQHVGGRRVQWNAQGAAIDQQRAWAPRAAPSALQPPARLVSHGGTWLRPPRIRPPG